MCIPGIQQVVCVCMKEGWRNSRRYVTQVGYNSAEENGGYLRNPRQISCIKSDITCMYMYMYHLFQTDIFYQLKNWRHADIAISLSPLSFLVFLAVRSWK